VKQGCEFGYDFSLVGSSPERDVGFAGSARKRCLIETLAADPFLDPIWRSMVHQEDVTLFCYGDI